MQKTLCALVFFLLLLILFGCITKVETTPSLLNSDLNSLSSSVLNSDLNFDLNSIYSIVQTDKDFNDFKLMAPEFVPTRVDCNNFSPNDLIVRKQDWNATNNALFTASPFFEKLVLSDKTIFCIFTGNKSDKYSLVAVINKEQSKSLMIVAVLKMFVGASG